MEARDFNRVRLHRVRSEIEELAKFHSTDVPMVYGDGEETIDKMVSLEELGRILSEIEDAIGEAMINPDACSCCGEI